PDPDSAEGSTDRCVESDWFIERSCGLVVGDSDHHRHSLWGRVGRRTHLSLFAGASAYDPLCLQWDTLLHRDHFVVVDRPAGRDGLHYLCGPYRAVESVALRLDIL